MIPIKIVLVKSKYPRNIGLVSRIMSNFSLQDLILVAPRCELGEEAKQGAAQGQGPLGQATTYAHWDDFFNHEPDGMRIAFSRRQGRRRASESLEKTVKLSIFSQERPTYLIFGAEDHGLSSEDLEHTHRLAHFELPGELQSMNLSHAVLTAVIAFYNQFKGQHQKTTAEKQSYKDPGPALRLWLESLDFDLESQKRWNALTMLKQLLMKATPTPEEIHRLEMIIQQTVRRIKNS